MSKKIKCFFNSHNYEVVYQYIDVFKLSSFNISTGETVRKNAYIFHLILLKCKDCEKRSFEVIGEGPYEKSADMMLAIYNWEKLGEILKLTEH